MQVVRPEAVLSLDAVDGVPLWHVRDPAVVQRGCEGAPRVPK
jgi:hypothetical protein